VAAATNPDATAARPPKIPQSVLVVIHPEREVF
jgi:hypothetical protein